MSQQRKKIFIDSSLWQRKWFDKLPIEYQMGYIILCVQSDNVGIWEPNLRLLAFHLKSNDFDAEDFIKALNSEDKRIELLSDGRWWLLDYLPLQVKTLTPNNRPHISYIELLHDHHLLGEYIKRFPENVNLEVLDKLQESDKSEDKKTLKYLDRKGLLRVLQEAYGKGLARGWQGSKDKDKEKATNKGEYKVKDKNERKDKSFTGNSVNEMINPKPSLYYDKVSNKLKKNIPARVLKNISQKELEARVKEAHQTLENNMNAREAENLILRKSNNIEWENISMDDFFSSFTNGALEHAPF